MGNLDSSFFRCVMQKQYSWIPERGIKEWWHGTNWTWSWTCMLHDPLRQGSDAKMEWLDVAAEPQNGQRHLWASVEVCLELPDSSLSHLSSAWKSILSWSSLGFLLLLFSTVWEANELINPTLMWWSADQLRELLSWRKVLPWFLLFGNYMMSLQGIPQSVK